MSPSTPSEVISPPRDRYEAWAKSYDQRTTRFSWSAPKYLLDTVISYAPPKGFLRVLDVGVGTGQASVPYLEAGACVTGLDVSASMLHEAQTKYPQFHSLIEHDFNHPLAQAGLLAQSFDLILSCGVLHFANDLAGTLSDLKWALAPGGMLAFTYIPPQLRTFSRATQIHAPEEVERMLRQAEFNLLEHRSLIAYYEEGDANDPVCYQLIVACCRQPGISLPTALQAIDRTACVDRSQLFSVVSQPLMNGQMTTQWTENLSDVRRQNQDLVDVLRSQIHTDGVEPRSLPLPKITADLARQGAPKCDVLVLTPHPDDESIYAGGTVAALAEAGQSVFLIVATDGGAGRGGEFNQLVTQRAVELRHAAKTLGIRQVENLGLADFGKYRDQARTRPITAADALQTWGLDQTLALIVYKLRQHRPRVLLTLHPEADPNYSLHGHHLGLGIAALAAFHLAADPEFMLKDAPELAPWAVEEHHAMIPPHHEAGEVRRIEINRDLKLRAVQAYQTQHYSTQRLIVSLKSNTPESAFETLQILQARCRRTQLTAIALSSDERHPIFANQRDWLSIYNQVRQCVYPRQALTDLLQQQAEDWGTSDSVLTQIEKLRDANTVAVVTGQQVGLLGGPAYTLYKALGAIKLAQQLDQQGIPAVPIFWLASYDHDLAEVQRVELFAGRSRPDILSLDLPITQTPVGCNQLGSGICSLLDELARSLKNLPFSQDVITTLRAIYQPNATFSLAFARWLSDLTQHQGLIILDPAKRQFAELTRHILTRELFEAENSQTALRRTRQKLTAEGRAEIIPTDRDVLQLFFMDAEGVRRRLRRLEDGFEMTSTHAYLSNDAARNILRRQPERFTPSALLRPICQDAVLPTIAYVAGPTEQQYFTQLCEVYAWASVPMPEIVARPAFTLIDSHTASLLEEAGGVAVLLNSDDAGARIGRASLPIAVRLACNELRGLQSRCFKLRELGEANQPVEDKAKILQQDIAQWLITTALALETWAANRPLKAFACLKAELPPLVEAVCLDLQRSGSRGNPPSTRHITYLTQKLARFEHTLTREGRRQNPSGVNAFFAISPNGAPQERHLSIAELIATHSKSIISYLLPIASPDYSQTRLITSHK